METELLTCCLDLLRHLNPLLLPLSLHPNHHSWSRLLRPAGSTNDCPALRRQLRGDNPRLLVGRPFQRACPPLRRLRDNRRSRFPRVSRPTSARLRFAVRLSDRRGERVVQLHSAIAGLVEQ